MTQKNDAPVLVLALLVTLGLLGGGGWWLYQALDGQVSFSESTSSLPNHSPSSPSSGSTTVTPVISVGQVTLFPDGASVAKRAGIDAIATQDYATAVQSFQTALQTNRNDPESLIYLNNAEIGEKSAYTIAVVVPSPAAVDVAEELLRGVAQAQQMINAGGGIQGTPLRVAIAADNNDPDQAKVVAQALSQMAGLEGVVGHFSSDVSLAAADIYQANRMVMISPTSTSVGLSGAGDYIFRTVQSDRIAGDGLARYMLNTMGVTNVAVFYNEDSSYSQSLKDAFSSAVLTGGGRVVAEINLAAANFDAAQSIALATQQGAEALMLAANTPTRNQSLAVIQANQRRLKLLGGDSLYNADVLELGRDNAVGMVVAAAWHRDSVPGAKFPQEAQALWGGPVSWRTAMAYDATQALIQGMQSVTQSPDTLTSAMVQPVLAAPTFSAPGATEPIQFLPSGDRSLPSQLVTIITDPSTQLGYAFIPIR